MFELTLKFFAILNPLGCMAQVVSLLRHFPLKRQRQIIAREVLIALAILLSINYLGDRALAYLGIQITALQIGGGCILFLIAHSMLFPSEPPTEEATDTPRETSEPFIVPLAIPLIAGPGILSSILIEAEKCPAHIVTSALLLVWSISAAILLLAPQIGQLLGKKGLEVLDRFVGLLLILISVNMILEGLKTHFFAN